MKEMYYGYLFIKKDKLGKLKVSYQVLKKGIQPDESYILKRPMKTDKQSIIKGMQKRVRLVRRIVKAIELIK